MSILYEHENPAFAAPGGARSDAETSAPDEAQADSFRQMDDSVRPRSLEEFIGQAELLWGVPGMEKNIRLGWFVDAGQVWASGGTSAGVPGIDDSLRYSTGLSFAWISPVGPLKLSYAYPINKQDHDKTEYFQFQLGTNF